ncbi:MAG: putative CK1 protein kinase [Streblomastix strix]|uniref:Putative CK1 protein kinase n=1 Tax=Streblomastix strix TaxID=222440 RepID=A0A5J4X1A9_9EUKA|nr:MAG: putative CK1 protein kinase [Streblomastix strix]
MFSFASDDQFVICETIGDYKIDALIASGSNVSVYTAKPKNSNTAPQVAVKLERAIPNRLALNKEIIILKKVQSSNHYTKIFELGKHKDFKYLVTELLGPSLSDLAYRQPPYKFTLHTLLKFAYQAIEALQLLHQNGFIHCAVKSENFLIGFRKQNAGNIYLIHFNESRQFKFSDTTRGCLQTQIERAQTNSKSLINSDNLLRQEENSKQQNNDNVYFKDQTPEDDLIGVVNIISQYYEDVDQVNKMKINV